MFYIYNDNTLIKIEPQGIMFISLIPLLQEAYTTFVENLKEYEEKIFEEKLRLIKNLGGFVGNTFRKKGTGGAIYKLISYYKKFSPIQNFILEKNNLNKLFEKADNVDIFSFLRKKELIELQEFYDRKDFVVVNTYFTKKFLIDNGYINKKTSVYTFFSKIENEEKFKELSNIFITLNNLHYQNYFTLMDFKDHSFKIDKSNLVEWLSKLALQEELFSDVRDFNFQVNNLSINAKNNVKEHYVIQLTEKEDFVVYLEEHLNYLEIFDAIKSRYDYILLQEDEVIEYDDNKDKKFITFYAKSLTTGKRRVIYKVKYFSFKKEISNKEIKGCVVTKTPIAFQKEKPIFNTIEKSVKRIVAPEEFTITLEMIKINKETYESLLNFKKGIYSTIDQFPSFGGFIYKKEDIKDILNAIDSAKLYKDEIDFLKTRIYFAIKKKRFQSYEIPSVINTLNAEDIGNVVESYYTVNNFFYPIFYIPNLAIGNIYSYELPDKDTATIFDNRFANVDFCGRNYNSYNELEKIESSPFFAKDKDFIYGVDIFTGVDKYNMLIVGASGSGKSFTANIVLNGLLNTYKDKVLIDIIDSGHSYQRFLELRNGLDLVINKSSKKNCLNPFVLNAYIAMLLFLEKMANVYALSNETSEFKEFFEKDNNYFYIKKVIEIIKYNPNIKIVSSKEEMEKIDEEKFDILVWNEKEKLFITNFTYTSIHELHDILSEILVLMFGASKKGDPEFDLYAEEIHSHLSNIIYFLFSDRVKELIDNIENDTKDYYIKMLDKKVYFTPKEARDLLSILLDKSKSKMPQHKKDAFLIHADEFISFAKSGNLFNCEPKSYERQITGVELGEATDEKIKGVLISSIIMSFFNKMTSAKHKDKKKVLFIDEAHKLITDLVALKAIAYLYRTTRKHGASATLLSQSISDFFKTAEETDYLHLYNGLSQNSGWIWILGKGHSINDFKKLTLPDHIIAKFSEKPKKGQKKTYEFLLRSDITSNIVTLIASDFDYWSATTHAQEKLLISNFNILINDLFYTTFMLSLIFGKNFKSMFDEKLENLILETGARYINEFSSEESYLQSLIEKINDMLKNNFTIQKFFNYPLKRELFKNYLEAETILAVLIQMNKLGIDFIAKPK